MFLENISKTDVYGCFWNNNISCALETYGVINTHISAGW